MLCNSINAHGQNVNVIRKGCEYSIHIPLGWDTIPRDTLKKMFFRFDLDMGLYPKTQKEYFTGNYVLIGFIPALHTLNSYTFNQIVADMRKMGDKNKNIWSNDSITTYLDSIIPVNSSFGYWIDNYIVVHKGSFLLNGCQTLYLSKFGYIALTLYQKGNNAFPVDSLLRDFDYTQIMKVRDDYQYVPPQKKSFSFVYLLYSMGVGCLVYLSIIFFSKRKQVG